MDNLAPRSWPFRLSFPQGAPLLVSLLTALTGCAGETEPEEPSLDNSTAIDAAAISPADASWPDAGTWDAAQLADAAAQDAARVDAASEEAGTRDASVGADLSLCHLEPNEVVTLGDSFIALDPSYILGDSQPFVRNLEDFARAAGALAPGKSYRRYAKSGASMAFDPFIPKQLPAAIAEDPNIKLIVMDGGGNDMLVNTRSCLEYKTEAELVADPLCVKVVDDALAAGEAMFVEAAKAGVQAVVFFFYPHLPGAANGGVGAGTYPNTAIDYAHPRVQKMCEKQRDVRCYYVDMRPAFDRDGNGVPDQGMTNIDGIHPTTESSKITAGEVWKVMQAQCLASK